MSEQAMWLAEALLNCPPGDERRALPRSPAVGRLVCQTTDGEGPVRQALVQDVSALGIGLLLPDPPSPGAPLLLDLKAFGGERDVLSRVVHATPQSGGWRVGCAFVRDLDDASLRPFRAARVTAPAGDSRRWVRFRCDVEAVCYSVDTTPGERSPARVLDASAGGLGLVVPGEFRAGTLLRLDLPIGGDPGVFLRVVRSAPLPVRGWFLGCEFVDWLSAEELAALL